MDLLLNLVVFPMSESTINHGKTMNIHSELEHKKSDIDISRLIGHLSATIDRFLKDHLAF